MNRMNSHKRQSSSSSFSLANDASSSFSSLDNFMNATKLMEDEIMVPSKLREKTLTISKSLEHLNGSHHNGVTNGDTNGCTTVDSDVLEHYKFIRFVRNQFLHSRPFQNIDDYKSNEIKDKHFKKTLDELSYHYNGLMILLDKLSLEAKAVTEVYRESV